MTLNDDAGQESASAYQARMKSELAAILASRQAHSSQAGPGGNAGGGRTAGWQSTPANSRAYRGQGGGGGVAVGGRDGDDGAPGGTPVVSTPLSATERVLRSAALSPQRSGASPAGRHRGGSGRGASGSGGGSGTRASKEDQTVHVPKQWREAGCVDLICPPLGS